MQTWNHILDAFQSSRFTTAFADASLKSFIVLGIAVAVGLGWRRASAATRHVVWLLAVVACLFLPVLSVVLPAWQKPLWRVATWRDSRANELTVALDFTPANARTTSPSVRAPEAAVGALTQDKPGSSRFGHMGARLNKIWLVLVPSVWLGGIVFVLTPSVIGMLRLRGLRSRAGVFQDPDWTTLFEELSRDLKLDRRVTLMQSFDSVMPLTWGWRRPVVMLPAEAGQWLYERRRVVLLHELGHVKRWDCLTQIITRLGCAIYWFNPLIWLAARRMAIEREQACDDLVLNGGLKASDYADHLLEIAQSFRHLSHPGTVAMARPAQIKNRIVAIVDASRHRRAPGALWMVLGCAVFVGFVTVIAGQKAVSDEAEAAPQETPWWDGRLRAFFAAKEQHARRLAALENKQLAPEIWPYFQAGMNGGWKTATNLWVAMRARAHQYENTIPDETLSTAVWSPILETDLAWEQFANWQQKYVLAYGNDIISSIPDGGIYFGGTDPGRGVITAMSTSQAQADPFFTITQNALADGTYLDYVRLTYGDKIYTPTSEDSQNSFQEYVTDAQKRLGEDKLKPGEDVKMVDGKVNVQGQVAVMAINGLLTRLIFDKNPEREFYVEESFPLDWMYPHLLPNGLIMKINREPLTELPEEAIGQDHEYWSNYLEPMIGNWLTSQTTAREVAGFVEKVYHRGDLSGFTGDPEFLKDGWSPKAFSKLRSSIGGIYSWRLEQTKDSAVRQRMMEEADFAFRQAFVLCPTSPEAVFRYVNLLLSAQRFADAELIVATSIKVGQRDPQYEHTEGQFKDLLERIQQFRKQAEGKR